MHINNDLYNDYNCPYWVPSLLIPILLVPNTIEIEDFIYLKRKCTINIPIYPIFKED